MELTNTPVDFNPLHFAREIVFFLIFTNFKHLSHTRDYFKKIITFQRQNICLSHKFIYLRILFIIFSAPGYTHSLFLVSSFVVSLEMVHEYFLHHAFDQVKCFFLIIFLFVFIRQCLIYNKVVVKNKFFL